MLKYNNFVIVVFWTSFFKAYDKNDSFTFIVWFDTKSESFFLLICDKNRCWHLWIPFECVCFSFLTMRHFCLFRQSIEYLLFFAVKYLPMKCEHKALPLQNRSTFSNAFWIFICYLLQCRWYVCNLWQETFGSWRHSFGGGRIFLHFDLTANGQREFGVAFTFSWSLNI